MEFHAALKIGDIVDTVKTEENCDRSRWAKAKIIGFNPENSIMELHFLRDA